MDIKKSLLLILLLVGTLHATKVKPTVGVTVVASAITDQDELDKLVDKLNKEEETTSKGKTSVSKEEEKAIKAEEKTVDKLEKTLDKLEKSVKKSEESAVKSAKVQEVANESIASSEDTNEPLKNEDTTELDTTGSRDISEDVTIDSVAANIDKFEDASGMKDEVASLDGVNQEIENNVENDPVIETKKAIVAEEKSLAELEKRLDKLEKSVKKSESAGKSAKVQEVANESIASSEDTNEPLNDEDTAELDSTDSRDTSDDVTVEQMAENVDKNEGASGMKDEVANLDGVDQEMENNVNDVENDVENDPSIEKRAVRRVYDCPPKSCAEVRRRNPGARSRQYQIYINGHMRNVFCEMEINGGGYTFLDKYTVGYSSYLTQRTIDKLFRRRGDVLLRFQKPDNTQAYTIIRPRSRYWLSVQLNGYKGYTRPVNTASNLGRYLYLGTTPAKYAKHKGTQGFISNNRHVSYRNCDGNANNYFAFFSNMRNRRPSSYHKSNTVYERKGVAVTWRRTGILYCASTIPSHYFFTTEMHFGGCGAYTTSDRWLKSAFRAKKVAIGVR